MVAEDIRIDHRETGTKQNEIDPLFEFRVVIRQIGVLTLTTRLPANGAPCWAMTGEPDSNTDNMIVETRVFMFRFLDACAEDLRIPPSAV